MLTVPRPEELLEGFLTGNERQQLRFWPQLQAQAPQLQEFAWQKLQQQPRTAISWSSGALLRLLASDSSMLEQIKAEGGRLIRAEVKAITGQSPFTLELSSDSGTTTIQADRIVNAVAAYERTGCATIVVDFGTATTFDAVSTAGE